MSHQDKHEFFDKGFYKESPQWDFILTLDSWLLTDAVFYSMGFTPRLDGDNQLLVDSRETRPCCVFRDSMSLDRYEFQQRIRVIRSAGEKSGLLPDLPERVEPNRFIIWAAGNSYFCGLPEPLLKFVVNNSVKVDSLKRDFPRLKAARVLGLSDSGSRHFLSECWAQTMSASNIAILQYPDDAVNQADFKAIIQATMVDRFAESDYMGRLNTPCKAADVIEILKELETAPSEHIRAWFAATTEQFTCGEIQPLEPLTTEERQAYSLWGAWSWVEAIFIMNGFKPVYYSHELRRRLNNLKPGGLHQTAMQTDIELARGYFGYSEVAYFVDRIQLGYIGKEVIEAGEKTFKDLPANWERFWLDRQNELKGVALSDEPDTKDPQVITLPDKIDKPKTRLGNQQDAILTVIKIKKFDPMAIPDGEKGTIKAICEADYPQLFSGDTSFDRAWKLGITELWKMEYHDSFAKRGKKT